MSARHARVRSAPATALRRNRGCAACRLNRYAHTGNTRDGSTLSAWRFTLPRRCAGSRTLRYTAEGCRVIRLVAIDLDGTLLDSQGQVPARNQQVLAEVQRLGVEVVLVTGRRFEFARQASADVPGDPVLIVNNGAVIRRRQGDPLFRQTLPAAVARRVLAAAQPFRQYAALVFDRDSGGQVVFEHLDWSDPSRRNYLERNRPFLRVCTPLEAALTEDPIQVMFAGPLDKLGTLRTLLESSGGRDFTLAVTEYPARNFAILDVLAPGCSKGAALR